MATKKKKKAAPKPKRPGTPKKAPPKVKKSYEEELASNLKDHSLEIIEMADDHTFAPSGSELIPSGIMALDRAFGFAGWPARKIVELYGNPHCGKTTFAGHALAQAQKAECDTFLLETEKTSSIPYFSAMGADPRKIKLVKAKEGVLTMEGCAEALRSIAGAYRGSPKPTLVVWDSLGATPTQSELDRNIGDKKVGDAAGVLKQAFRILPQMLSEANIMLLIINHQYTTIGHISRNVTYGGTAVKYLSSLRIELRRVGPIKVSTGEIIGLEGELRVIKNKYGMPERKIRYAIMDGVGVDNVWYLHNELSSRGLIEKSGSWFKLNMNGTEVKYQGHSGLGQRINEIPELWSHLCQTYSSLIEGER